MKKLLGVLWIAWLCLAPTVWAATSLQYTLPGTPVTFADSAQTPTRAWTLSALANSAGRVSVQHDKGTGAQPSLWQFVCRVQLTGTNVPGSTVEFYVVPGDGTDTAGGVGTADAALASSDKRRNLTFMGVLVADQGTTNVQMTAVFSNVYIPSRYYSLAAWNSSGLPLKTDTAAHRCTGTPMPFQMQ